MGKRIQSPTHNRVLTKLLWSFISMPREEERGIIACFKSGKGLEKMKRDCKKTKNRIVGLCVHEGSSSEDKLKGDGETETGVKGHLLSCDINLNPGRFSSVQGCCSLQRDRGKERQTCLLGESRDPRLLPIRLPGR